MDESSPELVSSCFPSLLPQKKNRYAKFVVNCSASRSQRMPKPSGFIPLPPLLSLFPGKQEKRGNESNIKAFAEIPEFLSCAGEAGETWGSSAVLGTEGTGAGG